MEYIDKIEDYEQELIADRYQFNRSKDLLYQDEKSSIFVAFDQKQNNSVIVQMLPVDSDNFINDGKQQNKLSFLTLKRLQENQKNYNHEIIDSVQSFKGHYVTIFQNNHIGSLNQYIQKSRYIDERLALQFFKQICLGLKSYHDLGIAHNSLNFENIIICKENIRISQLKQTVDHQYQAPEILEGETGTIESDIWSLGIILFKMLTGEFYYSGSPQTIINNIAHENPNLPDSFDYIFPVNISEEIMHLIKSILVYDIQSRPTIDQILENQLVFNSRTEVQKKYKNFIKIPENYKSNYFFHEYTRDVQDHDSYQKEYTYVGFQKETQEIIKLKKTEIQNQRDIQKCVTNLLSFQQSHQQNLIQIHEFIQLDKETYVITEYCNQGYASAYIEQLKQKKSSTLLNEDQIDLALSEILQSMESLNKINKLHHGCFTPTNLYVHKGKLIIGEPLMINKQTQKKFKENAQAMDFFAPEFKENYFENKAVNFEKIDIWSFGMVFSYLVFGTILEFDNNNKPVFSFNVDMSEKNKNLLQRCLQVDPNERANWEDLKSQNMPFSFENRRQQDTAFSQNNNSRAAKRYQRNKKHYNLENPQKQLQQQQEDISPYISNNSSEVMGLSHNPQSFKVDDDVIYMDESFQQGNKNEIDFEKNLKLREKARQGKQKNTKFTDLNESTKKLRQFQDDEISNDEQQFSSDQQIQQSKNKKQSKNYYDQNADDEKELTLNQARMLLRKQDNDVMRKKIRPQKINENDRMHHYKQIVKVSLTVILLYAVFFREFVNNSLYLIFKRADYKVYQFQLRNEYYASLYEITLLSNDQEYLIQLSDADLLKLVQDNNCFDNIYDKENHPNIEVVDSLHSGAFFWWAFFGLIICIAIIILKAFQVWKLDFWTILQYQRGKQRDEFTLKKDEIDDLKNEKKYLMHSQIVNYLEFAFLYYAHFQIFSFFYFVETDKCFGIKQIDDVDIMFDSAEFFFLKQGGSFFTQIIMTLFLFFIFHYFWSAFHIFLPLEMSSLFSDFKRLFAPLRVISFVFGCWILNRIGGLMSYEPTYASDDQGIIGALLSSGNSVGVFGFIPEIFELILFLIDVGVDFILYKAVEAQKIARIKNMKKNGQNIIDNTIVALGQVKNKNRNKRISQLSRIK